MPRGTAAKDGRPGADPSEPRWTTGLASILTDETDAGADRPAAAGVGASLGSRPRGRVHRFSATERWLHAANAVAFLLLLATGLALFLPFVAQVFGNRPVVKAIHLAVAALWLTAIVLTPILGDRRVLRRTRQQFEGLTSDDLRWLRSRAAREAPQGKFNGGQKFHAVLQGALTFLFFVSGTLLYLGERNTAFRLPGTIALHDIAMVVGAVFVAGHVYIATSPQARPSLSGMTDGTVPASYAAEHHPRWDPAEEPVEQRPPLTPLRATIAFTVLACGVAGAVALAGG